MSEPQEAKLRRQWRERFMRALASLEPSEADRLICGGCRKPFDGHTGDYAECVQGVLADDGKLPD